MRFEVRKPFNESKEIVFKYLKEEKNEKSFGFEAKPFFVEFLNLKRICKYLKEEK